MAHIRRDSGSNRGSVVARDTFPVAQVIIDEKAGEEPYFTITMDPVGSSNPPALSRFTLYLSASQRQSIVEQWQRAEDTKSYWRIPK